MARIKNTISSDDAPEVDLSKGAQQIGRCILCTHGIEHRHDRPVTDEERQRLRDHLNQEEAKRLKV